MDFWDVLKLTVRRWYIALPALLITAVGAVLALVMVKPEYVGTTSVILLPPTARNDTAGTTQVNPWEPNSLSLATITYINSKQLHEELKAQGLSDVWAANLDERSSSLINLEVTGSTPAQTLSTSDALQTRIVAEISRLQQPYNLRPVDLVTAININSGKTLAPSTSKSKRTLIVVVAVGVIITIAVTVSVDALARRRARRRIAADGLGPDAESPRRSEAAAATPESPAQRVIEARPSGQGTPARRPYPTVALPAAPTAIVEVNSPGQWSEPPGQQPDLIDLPTNADSTTTIVLPLSNPMSKRGSNGGRGPDGSGPTDGMR